ncbi:LuxR C-terminal-related transcriptional regulator [Streptomyces sp. NPDC049906]|uniref:ATP-binding protein n=1 Tax=Streptomyces sp. NPDC049906 TaxID=3155656 RepID=UPI00343B3AAF
MPAQERGTERPRVWVERGEVTAAAAEAAAAVHGGDGRWVRISAAVAGMGRSAALDEIVRRQAVDGVMRVGRARGAPEETEFPFGVVRQLFADDVGVPFTALDGPDEQRVFHRLVTHTARIAAERPVLFVVDDLHHADEASRRWIGYLARRFPGLPVLLVLSACAEASDPVRLPAATGTSVLLPPLSASAVTGLARAAGLDEERTATCVAAGAGNPALVHALVADLADGPLPRPPSAATRSRYRDTIVDWVRHRLDPHARHACLALAVAAEEEASGPGLLDRLRAPGPHGRASGGHPDSALGALLRHPLARDAVLAAAEPGEVAALRIHLAESLHENGAAATAVASRLLHVAALDEEWMVRALDEAADEALRAGRAAEAATYLRHALSGPLAPDRRAALAMRLGALELPHSATAGIRRLRTGWELHTDVREQATAATALSAALVADRRPDTALRVMQRASRMADDDGLVPVLQTLTALISSHDAVAWRGAVADLRALAPRAPAGVEPLVCGLITEYEAGAGLCSAAEVLARVGPRLTAPVDPRLRTSWLGSAATLLQWADRLVEARELADACLPAPPAPPDLTDVGVQCLLSVRAEAALWAGDFRTVIAENAPLVSASAGQGVQLPHLTAMVTTALFELGRRAEAWETLTAVGPSGTDSSWEWSELGYARALLHAADGAWREALDAYLACGAGQSARDFVSPVATPWRSGAAIVLARLGRWAEARELAEVEVGHARTWGTARTVGRALRAYAAAVGGRQALESLVEAAEVLGSGAAPVELTETLLDLGRAHLAAGNGRKGRAALREAHALALRLAAPAPGTSTPSGRLLALTDGALREGGVRKRARSEDDGRVLTAAERRIVELAAAGHTNAQISSVLCLARRTVESHLTNAYKKLRITRRTQLAAALAADARTTDGAPAGGLRSPGDG